MLASLRAALEETAAAAAEAFAAEEAAVEASAEEALEEIRREENALFEVAVVEADEGLAARRRATGKRRNAAPLSIDDAKARRWDAIFVLGGGAPLGPRTQPSFVASRSRPRLRFQNPKFYVCPRARRIARRSWTRGGR